MRLNNNALAALFVIYLLLAVALQAILYLKIDSERGKSSNQRIVANQISNSIEAEGTITMCFSGPLVVVPDIPNFELTSGENLNYDFNTTKQCTPYNFSIYAPTLTNYLFDANTGEFSYVAVDGDIGINTVTIYIKSGDWQGNDTFNITVSSTQLSSPYLDISLDSSDNKTVVLNWSEVGAATQYRIYYTSDVDQIRDWNVNSVTHNASTAGQTWTDNTADSVRERYYIVAAYNGSYENASRIVGKYDLWFFANNDTLLGRNLFSIPFNETPYVSEFVKRICGLEPTVTKLDRSSVTLENYLGHTCLSGSTNNFSMATGLGFYIYVNESYNYTVVGPLYEDNLTLEFVSDSTGRYGRNLFGIHHAYDDYYAQGILDPLCPDYYPSITHLERESDVNLEDYKGHTCISYDTNNFTITWGMGMFMYVNHSINYTIH